MVSMNNQFLFQMLYSEEDGECVASGTKPLEKLSLAPDVFCMPYKCSGFFGKKTELQSKEKLRNW